MKSPKFNSILVTLLLVTELVFSQQVIRFQNISVIYSEADSAMAQHVCGYAATAHRELESYFEEPFPDSIYIRLSSNTNQYLNQAKVPGWSGGSAIPSRNTIFLNQEEFLKPGQPFLLVSHEMAHLFIGKLIYPHVIPVWMHEGLAMRAAGESVGLREHAGLANAIANDKLLTFSRIDSLLRFPRAQARLAYTQSLIAVQFWAEKIGEENVNTFLRRVGQGEETEFVLWQFAHITFSELEQVYRAKLEREYSWFFLLNFDSVLWGSLVALVVLIFIIRKIRNRRILRHWDNEEENF